MEMGLERGPSRGLGMSKQEEIKREIWALRQAVPEVTGIMVASRDGLAIATDFPEALGARMAAMATAALGLGTRITQTLGVGGLEEVVIRGGAKYVVVYAAGEGAVLAVEAPREVNLGLLHLEARGVAARIAELVGTAVPRSGSGGS